MERERESWSDALTVENVSTNINIKSYAGLVSFRVIDFKVPVSPLISQFLSDTLWDDLFHERCHFQFYPLQVSLKDFDGKPRRLRAIRVLFVS